MPLTVRTNGSGGSNLITASWFNDFLNLFTGAMQDQIITFQTDVQMKAIGGSPGAPTLALATGTTLGIGAYKYCITFVDGAGGESLSGTTASITTTSGNQSVSLTAIPTGPTGTTKRRIYRTKVGASSLLLLAALNDNTTTIYTDNIADTSLGQPAPAHASFGGMLQFRDQNNNVINQLSGDGSFQGNMTLQGLYWYNPAAPTLTLAAGTNLGIGVYKYCVTFVSYNGETTSPNQATITTTSGNQQVNLTNIPLGPSRTIARKIYRTAVGGSSFLLLTTLNDNSTTTFTDSTADGSLGASIPFHPTFGGALYVQDQNGNINGQIFSDGAFSLDGGKITSDGNGNLSLTATDPVIYTSRTNGMNFGANGSIFFTCQLSSNGGIKLWNSWTSNYGFQFMRTDGTILAEIRATDGAMIIKGSTYYTNAATVNWAASQAFTGFDIAEVYETDQQYSYGTVCVPDPTTSKMVKCTTDGHPLAHVIVQTPGYCAGNPDPTNNIYAFALAGRVLANTAVTITAGQRLCADNNGGVRPLTAGEWKDSLGVAITNSSNGQVGIILRPCYAQG